MRARLRWQVRALRAVLPTPAGYRDRPPEDEAFWGAFFARFEASAPAHLRLATALGGVALGAALPWALRLDPTRAADAERALAALARLPGGEALLAVLKIVASLALFDDPAAQARVRGG